MHVLQRSLPLIFSSLVVACVSIDTAPDGGSPTDAGSSTTNPTDDAGSAEVLGEAEQRYLVVADQLADGITTTDFAFVRTLSTSVTSLSANLTNEKYKTLSSTRLQPVLAFMTRKLCNDFGITGDLAVYKAAALADSPAASFLSGTPLLQAIVEQKSTVDSLLAPVNAERSAQGLGPMVVADYQNSVVGGPTSTVIFVPGWPGRPKLDQWLQVQRAIRELFFVTLEPRADGSYASFVTGRSLTTTNGVSTVATTVGNGTCLKCHSSGKPLRLLPLSDVTEAAKVNGMMATLQAYPARTNHPDYNPFPSSPGIGTSGALTLEEASTFAGRTLTTTELATLNRNTACDSCHNDVTQNALRPPLDNAPSLLMEDGRMPPGAGVMTTSERTEALKVMLAHYKVKLKRYFRGQ